MTSPPKSEEQEKADRTQAQADQTKDPARPDQDKPGQARTRKHANVIAKTDRTISGFEIQRNALVQRAHSKTDPV